jgi:hypothetical protein
MLPSSFSFLIPVDAEALTEVFLGTSTKYFGITGCTSVAVRTVEKINSSSSPSSFLGPST